VSAGTPVRVDRDGSVAVVTLSRQDKANAMDGEITEALLSALDSLSARGDVRAMVLTGQGAAFSAGGDVETIKQMEQDRMFRDAILGAHQRLFRRRDAILRPGWPFGPCAR
jgi:enoyl-CoA hydratase